MIVNTFFRYVWGKFQQFVFNLRREQEYRRLVQQYRKDLQVEKDATYYVTKNHNWYK